MPFNICVRVFEWIYWLKEFGSKRTEQGNWVFIIVFQRFQQQRS